MMSFLRLLHFVEHFVGHFVEGNHYQSAQKTGSTKCATK